VRFFFSNPLIFFFGLPIKMNSNFDDLLNEYDSDYTSPAPVPQSRAARLPSNDIDDFLEELKSLEKPEKVTPMRQISKPEERKKSLQKCYPTVISGSIPCGYCSSSANLQACDRLRCTRCDLPVKRFVNKQWKPSAEYLFFRNNFSRDDKLSEMMLSAPGYAAYNCQCLWKSTNENSYLNGDAWVCGGHMV